MASRIIITKNLDNNILGFLLTFILNYWFFYSIASLANTLFISFSSFIPDNKPLILAKIILLSMPSAVFICSSTFFISLSIFIFLEKLLTLGTKLVKRGSISSLVNSILLWSFNIE